MDTKALEDIGLTQGEIKIYMALLELGSSSAGRILKKANIQNSVFHFCVNSLIEKGLISYVKKNKFRIYSAANPDNFIIYVKDKQKQLEKILPELKAKQNFAEEKQETEIFDGVKGIMTLLNILIEDTKKGDEFLMFTAEAETKERSEEIQKFYEMYDAKRKEKGLVVKGIANYKLQSIFEKRKTLKMKYTQLPVPANTGICNNKIVFISWGDKPTGILIKSKDIVDKQRKFFNAFWDSL